MNRLFLLLISVLSLFGKSYTWTEKLSVENGDCDSYEIRYVNNDHPYEIDWNGGQIPIYCSFGFIGRDSVYENEYKVCIEATHYSVSDCTLKMKYETGIGSDLREKYSCNEVVEKFCGDSDDYVDVVLTRAYSMPTQNGGKITLKVTANMTYNYAVTFGASVAGAVVGVIILSLCTFMIRRKSNRRSGGLIQTTTTTYNPQTNVYTYSEQRIAHSQMYPNTQQYTEPPPSYQNVVTTSGNLVSPVAGTKS